MEKEIKIIHTEQDNYVLLSKGLGTYELLGVLHLMERKLGVMILSGEETGVSPKEFKIHLDNKKKK